MDGMGRHNLLNGHRGEDGAAAAATLEAPAISPALQWQRLVPVPLPQYRDQTLTEELVEAARGIDGDKVIRVLTAIVVLAVAAFAAVVSYSHIFTLGRLHGQDGTAARLLPLSVDGLIAAASLVMLHAARNRIRLRLVSWPRAMLVLGVAATVAANVFYGLPFGWLAAVISAWPAVAFIGSVEMAMRLVRDARAAGAGDDSDSAAEPGRWRPAWREWRRRHRQQETTDDVLDDDTEDASEDGNPNDSDPPPLPPPDPPNPRPRNPSGRARALAILKRNPGLPDAEVAKRAKVSERTVQRARSELPKASAGTALREGLEP